jgi:hypothetical protein
MDGFTAILAFPPGAARRSVIANFNWDYFSPIRPNLSSPTGILNKGTGMA